jgi:hypothetical protein
MMCREKAFGCNERNHEKQRYHIDQKYNEKIFDKKISVDNTNISN